jgi:hypothetical protein
MVLRIDLGHGHQRAGIAGGHRDIGLARARTASIASHIDERRRP